MGKKQTLSTDFRILTESLPGLYIILLAPDFEIAAVSDDYLEATVTKREEIIGRGLFDLFADNSGNMNTTEVYDLKYSLNSVLEDKKMHSVTVQKYNTQQPGATIEKQLWTLLNKPVLNSKQEIEYIIHHVQDITSFITTKEEEEVQKDKLVKELRDRLIELEKEISVLSADVSERKKAEAEISKLNEELEKKVMERTFQLQAVNKELESFSYSVSHDLRAPLRAVDGYSKMIEEDYKELLDEEGKRLLEVVQYNARKMGALIDDLLAFSRLGKKELQKTTIDMEELTEGALMELNKLIEHHAEIKIKKLHPVKADYSLMNQVMINLVSNAIKYSSKKEKSIVEISSAEKGDEIIFTIKDNGVGFDMQYADKLFGVFQRLHTLEEFDGTGVGLAIVQRIINKHGGRIWAKGKVGEGATFNFTLPVY